MGGRSVRYRTTLRPAGEGAHPAQRRPAGPLLTGCPAVPHTPPGVPPAPFEPFPTPPNGPRLWERGIRTCRELFKDGIGSGTVHLDFYDFRGQSMGENEREQAFRAKPVQSRIGYVMGDGPAANRYAALSRQAGAALPFEFVLERRLWEDSCGEAECPSDSTRWFEFLVVTCYEQFEYVIDAEDRTAGRQIKLRDKIDPFAVSVMAIDKILIPYGPERLADFQRLAERALKFLPPVPPRPVPLPVLRPETEYRELPIFLPRGETVGVEIPPGPCTPATPIPKNIGEFCRELERAAALRNYAAGVAARGSEAIGIHYRAQAEGEIIEMGFQSHPFKDHLESFLLEANGRMDAEGLNKLIGRVGTATGRGADEVRRMTVDEFLAAIPSSKFKPGAKNGKRKGGRKRLSEDTSEPAKKRCNVYEIIRRVKEKTGFGPVKLHEHFAGDKDFTNLVKNAGLNFDESLYKAAERWCKNNPATRNKTPK